MPNATETSPTPQTACNGPISVPQQGLPSLGRCSAPTPGSQPFEPLILTRKHRDVGTFPTPQSSCHIHYALSAAAEHTTSTYLIQVWNIKEILGINIGNSHIVD